MLPPTPGLRQFAACAETAAPPLAFVPPRRFLPRSFLAVPAIPAESASAAPSSAPSAARRFGLLVSALVHPVSFHP
jgi:hypothetical protein